MKATSCSTADKTGKTLAGDCFHLTTWVTGWKCTRPYGIAILRPNMVQNKWVVIVLRWL